MFEKILRKYSIYLTEALGLAETTIDSKLHSLNLFWNLYKSDLKKISPKKLIKLKSDIKTYQTKGKLLSIKIIRRILGDISQFLTWLSLQPGYKSRIQQDTISYLSLSNKQIAESMISKRRDFPFLEFVVNFCKKIEINNIIDQRDRAIIAFLMCFGVRNAALRSLQLGSIDPVSLELNQSPLDGVNTKFTKEINTCCFRFHPDLVQYIHDWIKTLYTIGFSNSDPLFPRTKFEQSNGSFKKRTKIEAKFIKSSTTLNKMIKQRSEQCGVRVYSAHCFRHSCANNALKSVQNAHEFKAVSQQFGHKTIGLLLTTYGNLQPHQQREVIENMTFDGKNKFNL